MECIIMQVVMSASRTARVSIPVGNAVPAPHLCHEPVFCGFHPLRTDAAAFHPTIALALDQSGLFQDVEMLGDGGHGHVKGRCQLAHGRLALCQPLQDGAPRTVRQGTESAIQDVC